MHRKIESARELRIRQLGVLAVVAITCGGLAATGGTAEAATVTCPTVSGSGALTPAPSPGVDWAGCDLGAANLAGANLSGANLSGVRLLSGNLTGATLTGANLTGADVAYANLTNADLTGADLTGADLAAATLAKANLTDANLTGTTLTDVSSGEVTGIPADLPANWTMLSGYLAGPTARLDLANFAGENLSGYDLAGAFLGLANLSGTNLSGADLASASLTKANLTNADISGTDLSGADLSKVRSGGVTGSPATTLPANWSLQDGYLLGPEAFLPGVDLTSANLAGLDLEGAYLVDANLAGLDLSGTNLADAYLTNANVNGAELTGANLKDTHFGALNGTPASLPTGYFVVTVPAGKSTPGDYLVGPGAYLYEVDFSGQDLSNADLGGADLSDANLSGANLTGADLAGAFLNVANLTGANLTSANATSTNFGSAILASADLSNTNLTGADLGNASSGGITGTPASVPDEWALVKGYLVGPDAHLEGADLSGADLKAWHLDSAVLMDANLSNADLSGASFGYTQLGGANLTGADLAGAEFGHANLSGANATNANFTLAQFGDTNVSGLVMTGADFTNAYIYGNLPGLPGGGLLYTSAGTGTPKVPPMYNTVVDGFIVGPYVTIQGVSLAGANFSKLDLQSAFITNTDLTSANLDDVNLADASITNSNLTSVNLDDANLASVDLQGDTVTGTTTSGASWWNTTCPDGTNSDKYIHGCFSPMDTTPPVVTITGVPVPNRGVYVLGHVPTPGCKTTDNGTVANPAGLTIKTVASRGAGKGVGLITATCSGAVDLAGNVAAPVSVSYTNVYGTTGFLSPANGATFARATRVITVRFRLTDSTGKVIPASTAEAFAAAHDVHITMAGPGITATTNTCAWIAAQQDIACAIHVPATVKAGSSQRYTITATENVSTVFQAVPGVHGAIDPEVIHFR
jgi:uncharacterized protein YjbI with pentapeptide repeats